MLNLYLIAGPSFPFPMPSHNQSKYLWFVPVNFDDHGLTVRHCLQFEDLISNTIDETKNIPETISETGKIGVSILGEL